MVKLEILCALLCASVFMVEGQYSMIGEPLLSPNGATVYLQLLKPNSSHTSSRRLWDDEEPFLTLTTHFESNERLRIKIIPTTGPSRWQVPLEIQPPMMTNNSDPLYTVELYNNPFFNFKVIRKSTNAVLFDTSVPDEGDDFVYAPQYLSLSWRVASEYVYGIGENEQKSFKHDFNSNMTYPLWSKDQPPDGAKNMYSVQPYYTVLEVDDGGNAHSVAILNSNAQEFNFKPNATIKYTSIGGILDFYIFLGPSVENSVQQWVSAVGRAPMPPYWSLGFHLCRYGYDYLYIMKETVDRMEQYDIPQDVQYGDIDIMDRKLDFTYDRLNYSGLPEYVRELKTKGIKFVTILDPGISIGEPAGTYPPFDRGQEMEVWVKRADGEPASGEVWPTSPVYFPDFSSNITRAWWIELIKDFHNVIEFDGLWIDMNEPANFIDGEYTDVDGCLAESSYNNPPYLPPIVGDKLWSGTLCMDTIQAAGIHYNTHSLYGWFQSEPTLAGARAATGKRSFILSRSTFLGSGKWAAHWLGDNYSRWSNLHMSIIGMLQFNHFGIPMVGADICGFQENSNPQLCQRWHQLGAFYPFSRNHGWGIYQDPASFGPEVASSTRTALRIRYTLLPYLYTLFHHHHTRGDTLVRAIWHEYPTDKVAAIIDRQFMWGSGLLVSAVLEENRTSVQAYFPDGRFYDYYDGAEVRTRGNYEMMEAPMDTIRLHVHGGSIIPTQEPARNTELSRNNPFGIIVALNDNNTAGGQMYFDDGDSNDPHLNRLYFLSEYTFADGMLFGRVLENGYMGMASKILNTIRVLGYRNLFRSIEVNGNGWQDFNISTTGEITIYNLQLPVSQELTVNFLT